MIEVFGYLLRTSFRNRFTRRLARLREPRYLLPFAVSILWFGSMVIRPIFFSGHLVHFVNWGKLPPDIAEAFVFVAGIVIFVWIALIWILPDKRAALSFSPAELHFLFPAPITRQQLVQYKLLQAQVGILFGSLISSFFTGARFMHPDGWARVFAFWLFFAILHLHGIAASFVRTDLMEAGWSAVRRRAISIVVALALVFAVYISAREAWTAAGATVLSWMAPDNDFTRKSFAEVSGALAHAGRSGFAGFILWPFLALPRLLLARSPIEFLGYGMFGVLLLVVHYLWVIDTDTSFEEASLELSQKTAERRLARERTRRTGGMLVTKARVFPWRLKPTGRPETALVWKNLINLTRVTPMRALFALTAFILAMMTWVIRLDGGGGLWRLAALICAAVTAFTSVLGPVFLRNDLREDLFRIDLLKTMPLAGHAIVWGEVLGSWSALAAIQAFLLAVGAFALFMSGGPEIVVVAAPWLHGGGAPVLLFNPGTSPLVGGVAAPWLYAGGAAALLVMPGLTLAAVMLQNALVVVLPAWVALGNSRARGFEASGQRILTMFGTLFALCVVALPAAASGGVASWLLAPYMGPACLLVGAVIAAAWMWGEVAIACRMLGGLVDRLDPSTAGIEAQED